MGPCPDVCRGVVEMSIYQLHWSHAWVAGRRDCPLEFTAGHSHAPVVLSPGVAYMGIVLVQMLWSGST